MLVLIWIADSDKHPTKCIIAAQYVMRLMSACHVNAAQTCIQCVHVCASWLCVITSHWCRGSCKDRLQKEPRHMLCIWVSGSGQAATPFHPVSAWRAASGPHVWASCWRTSARSQHRGCALFRLNSRREEADLRERVTAARGGERWEHCSAGM